MYNKILRPCKLNHVDNNDQNCNKFDDDGHDNIHEDDDDHDGDDDDDDHHDDDDDLGGRQAWLKWPMELLVNTNLLMSCAIIIMMITIDDNIQIFALIFFHSCAIIIIMRIMMTYIFLMMIMKT